MYYWIKCLQYLNGSSRLRYLDFTLQQIKCIIFVLIYSVSSIIFPSYISKIVDLGISNRNIGDIANYTITMLIVGCTMVAFQYLYQVSFYKFSQRFVSEIKEMVFEKLMNTNVAFWSKHKVGDMFTVLEEDISSIESLFTKSISGILSNTLIAVGISAYLIYIDKTIGIILILLTFSFALIQKKYGKKIEAYVVQLREEIADFSSYTNEILNNVNHIEMAGEVKRAYSGYCKKNRSVVEKAIKQLRMITVLFSIVSSYSVIIIFVVLLMGAQRVLSGTMTVGVLFSLIIYVQRMFGPINSIGSEYISFKKNIPIFRRIFEVLDNKEVIQEGNYTPDLDLSGKISVNRIDFSYEESNQILKGLSLEVQPGEVVGIVGKNGCGKTTLMKLFTKLCVPQKGEILIDEVIIGDYQTDYLHHQVGCLLQSEFILSGSLRDVLDTKNRYSDHEIIETMKEFCLAIKDFPDGLDTMIKENSLNLSGGQVQKIALIRLFLQNKSIYLLDEPTSAMDIEAEKVICNVIRRKLEGKTALIITHREQILNICDRKIMLAEEQENEQEYYVRSVY